MSQASRPESLNAFMNELFHNNSAADVTFQFNDGVKHHGHKLILSRSAVFERMLNGSTWNETKNGNLIKIEDIRSKDFYEVLRFIYNDTAYIN